MVCKYCIKLGWELALESYSMLKRIKKISSKTKSFLKKLLGADKCPLAPFPSCYGTVL